MGFDGCTTAWKFPCGTHLDTPADPTYYAAGGDIDIFVDIARVPEDAEGWWRDDGSRVDMSMDDALELLNEHVAAYFRKLSGGRFRITFVEGEEVEVRGDGSPDASYEQLGEILGYECEDYPCRAAPYFSHGAANRYAFTTLEVPDYRNPQYFVPPEVWDPSAPGQLRPFNVEGVLVNRYDQTLGTGPQARVRPAFYDVENPNASTDVGWGRDDHSLIVDGDSRDLGGGVAATVSRNADGSYDVTLAGGGWERR